MTNLSTKDENNLAPQGPGLDDRVGYRRPPVEHQFKSGQSGNRRGRPKGRPNLANAVKESMNHPVEVRMGGKSRRMASATAILHSLAQKVAQGDNAALFAILDIFDMTGRSNDITDEAHEKTALRLPKSFTKDEMDLVRSEAREHDRERYRMIAESDPERHASTDDAVPNDIRAGDAHVRDGQFEEALAAYLAEIVRCKVTLEADESDKQAQHDYRRVVSRIGLLADTHLHQGRYERAISVANVASTRLRTSSGCRSVALTIV